MAAAVPDNAAGMPDRRPHPCRRPLDRFRQLAQGLRRRLDDAALEGDVPRHIAIRGFGPLVRPGMAGIAGHGFLPAVRKRRRWRSRRLCWRRYP